jgi:hypothetical protein
MSNGGTPTHDEQIGDYSVMSRCVIVSSYVVIEDNCPIRFNPLGGDQVEIVCGQPRDGFEFIMSTEALRTFVKLGTAALAEMDALASTDEVVGELEQQSA